MEGRQDVANQRGRERAQEKDDTTCPSRGGQGGAPKGDNRTHAVEQCGDSMTRAEEQRENEDGHLTSTRATTTSKPGIRGTRDFLRGPTSGAWHKKKEEQW